MNRTLPALIVLLILAASTTARAEGHVVSGSVGEIPQDGTLYVAIYDEKGWESPQETATGYFQGTSYEVDGRRVVRYRFEDLSPGRYAIRAFLDTNGTGELEMGLFGPREPWGLYRDPGRLVGPPEFADVSFTVESDIHGADFRLR
jgi:uncharacterized protein (DUF2141 family)